MPTASIYDPKTEDDGWEDRNTANILFDFDRRVAEAGSFSLLKSADPMIRIGLRKNGSYECQFNDLELGIMVSRGSTVIYENRLDKVICTDQRYLMNCNLPTLQTEVIHTVQVWAIEGDIRITMRETFTIPDYQDQTTQLENPAGTVVYHDGYYPDDEQWERDQPYLPEGYVRPVPPT